MPRGFYTPHDRAQAIADMYQLGESMKGYFTERAMRKERELVERGANEDIDRFMRSRRSLTVPDESSIFDTAMSNIDLVLTLLGMRPAEPAQAAPVLRRSKNIIDRRGMDPEEARANQDMLDQATWSSRSNKPLNKYIINDRMEQPELPMRPQPRPEPRPRPRPSVQQEMERRRRET